MEDLKELAEPVIKHLKEKHHPYVEVVITQDGVKVKETVESIPCCSVGKLNGSKCSYKEYLNMSLK